MGWVAGVFANHNLFAAITPVGPVSVSVKGRTAAGPLAEDPGAGSFPQVSAEFKTQGTPVAAGSMPL